MGDFFNNFNGFKKETIKSLYDNSKKDFGDYNFKEVDFSSDTINFNNDKDENYTTDIFGDYLEEQDNEGT